VLVDSKTLDAQSNKPQGINRAKEEHHRNDDGLP
jgi:hypothetical protein